MRKLVTICLLLCFVLFAGCSTYQVSPDVVPITDEVQTVEVEVERKDMTPLMLGLGIVTAVGVEYGFWVLVLGL